MNASGTVAAGVQFSGPGTGLTGTAASLNIGGNAATAATATNALGLTGTPSIGVTNVNASGTVAAGTTFVAGNGKQPVSLLAQGAKCDGVTNDLAALQSAVALAISEGAAVQLPPLGCLITLPSGSPSLGVSITGNATIFGSGPASSLILTPDPPTFRYILFHQEAGTSLTLENMTLTGPSNAGSAGVNNWETDAVCVDGGGGTGQTILDHVMINGQFYQALNKSSTDCPTGLVGDNATTNYTLQVLNSDLTAFFQVSDVFTNAGTTVNDAAVTTGGVLTSGTASCVAGDVGETGWLTGSGARGVAVLETINSCTGAAFNITPVPAQSIVGTRSVTDANMQVDRTVTDGVTTAGSRQLTSATAAFTAADQDRRVYVNGAGVTGSYPLCALILTVTNSTTVQLSLAAGTSASSASTTIYANDDHKVTCSDCAFTQGDVGTQVTLGTGGSAFNSLIVQVDSSTQARVREQAPQAYTNAALTISGGSFSFGLPNLQYIVKNSYYHDLNPSLGPAQGYLMYVHPSVSVDIEGSRFDNAQRYALHNYSSSAIPFYVRPNYLTISNSYFGSGLRWAMATNRNTPVVLTGNTFNTNDCALEIQEGGIVAVNNKFTSPCGFGLLNPTSWVAQTPFSFTGGSFSGSAFGTMGMPNSNWTFDNVDMQATNGGSSLLTNTYDWVRVGISKSQIHGTGVYGLQMTKGLFSFVDNTSTGSFTGQGTVEVGGNYVRHGNFSHNRCMSNTYCLVVNDTSNGGAITGEANWSWEPGDSFNVAGAHTYENIQLNPGVFPYAVASASSVTLGGPANVDLNNSSGIGAMNFNTWHIFGTTTINTLAIEGATQDAMLNGAVEYLIADGAWALGSSGNIVALTASARTVGSVIPLKWNAVTGVWTEQGLATTGVQSIQNNGVAVTPSSGAVNLTPGTGIGLTTTGNTINIAYTGSGGGGVGQRFTGNCYGAVGSGTNKVSINGLGGDTGSGGCSTAIVPTQYRGTIATSSCGATSIKFYVSSSAGGHDSSDGVFQVYDGASAISGLTCTIGTGTKCNVTTTGTVAVGDILWVQGTTDGTSLSDISAAIECN